MKSCIYIWLSLIVLGLCGETKIRDNKSDNFFKIKELDSEQLKLLKYTLEDYIFVDINYKGNAKDIVDLIQKTVNDDIAKMTGNGDFEMEFEIEGKADEEIEIKISSGLSSLTFLDVLASTLGRGLKFKDNKVIFVVLHYDEIGY